MLALRLGDLRGARPLGEGAAAGRQHAGGDLAPLGDGERRRRVDGGGIGGVAVDEREIVAVAPPDRQRQGVERGAQPRLLGGEPGGIGERRGAPSGVADPHHVGDRPPVDVNAPPDGVDGAVALEAEGQGEGGAAGAQRLGRGGEEGGVLGHQLLEEIGEARRPGEAQRGDEAGREGFAAIGEVPAEGGRRRGGEERGELGEDGGLARQLAAAPRRLLAGGGKAAGDHGDGDEGDEGDGETGARDGRPEGAVKGERRDGEQRRAGRHHDRDRRLQPRRPIGSVAAASPCVHRWPPHDRPPGAGPVTIRQAGPRRQPHAAVAAPPGTASTGSGRA